MCKVSLTYELCMLPFLFRGTGQMQLACFWSELSLTTSRDGYKRIRIGTDACRDIASSSHTFIGAILHSCCFAGIFPAAFEAFQPFVA